MKKKRALKKYLLIGTLPTVLILGMIIFGFELSPKDSQANAVAVRIERPSSMYHALKVLQNKGIIKSYLLASLYAKLTGKNKMVESGVYLVDPSKSVRENMDALKHPILVVIRIPQTNWAERNGRLLQKMNLCDAESYMKDVQNPAKFQKYVSFKLPKNTLEGYLYPDTYEFQPFATADDVVKKQLQTFQKKVVDVLPKNINLVQVLKVGSLIELEVGRNDERPLVSAVIYNRLKKGMRLQIDASINYGLGVWRPLKKSDLTDSKTPYNLYLHNGLPPTPICSPSIKSILAAAYPASVNYIYYVALPSGKSLFASNFADHEKNIKLRKAALQKRSIFGRIIGASG